MKRAMLLALVLHCGGTSHAPVQEVPIEQSSAARPSGDLPPDEIGGDAAVTSTIAPVETGSGTQGTGPQPLLTSTVDAGPAGFTQRTGGLSQKDCTDVVLVFAKLTAKEKHTTAPPAADLQGHATYGPMVNDCGASMTQKQQKCGLVARTTAAWKKCME